MTDGAKAERERQFAETYRELLRARGLLRTHEPLAERQRKTVESALTSALEAQESHALYATHEQYQGWEHNPATLTPGLHDQHCRAGVIPVGRTSDVQTLPCPTCQTQARVVELRRKLVAAGVDGRYLDVEWDGLERPPPLDRLARACNDIQGILEDGESLLLWSEETGSGKSQAGMLAAKAALAAGRTALVANLARLSTAIRDGYGDRSGAALKESVVQQQLAAPDLLVLDDLGMGESDNASVERRLLFLTLDERQMHRRTTVITSNLRPEELAATFGARILARLAPLTIIHVNHGRNFRLNPGRTSRW